MKKLFLLGIATLGLIFLSGCVTPLNVGEVLQLPNDAKLYTRYNIWYEIPWDISSINYQRGKIIPFGTRIKLVSADPQRIKFEVVSTARTYTIAYHEKWFMQPIDGYIKQLVTTKDRSEQTKGISPEIRRLMLKGEIKKGMTKDEVEMTYGPPSPHRTPLRESLTWIYWDNRFVTKRVIFKKDKVIDILK